MIKNPSECSCLWMHWSCLRLSLPRDWPILWGVFWVWLALRLFWAVTGFPRKGFLGKRMKISSFGLRVKTWSIWTKMIKKIKFKNESRESLVLMRDWNWSRPKKTTFYMMRILGLWSISTTLMLRVFICLVKMFSIWLRIDWTKMEADWTYSEVSPKLVAIN